MIRVRVASSLHVAVETDVPAAQYFAQAAAEFGGPVAGSLGASIRVVPDLAAPAKRFHEGEYYTRVEWLTPRLGRVEVNGATGTIEWDEASGSPLRAELRIYPE